MAASAGAHGDNEVAALKGFKPAGLMGAAFYSAALVPIAAYQAARLLLDFLWDPKAFHARKDRTAPLPEPWAGIQHEFVTANGIRFHAVSPGPRDTSKLLALLLHGFPESWYSWRHQMRELAAQGYDVMAVDMRGYGETEKPPAEGPWYSNYRLEVLVEDVRCLVGALGHKTCTLIAHDWGGIVAWAAAAMHPEVFTRLCVMAAPHLGLSQVNMSAAQMARSWYIIWFQAPFIPEAALTQRDLAFLEDVFAPGHPMGPARPGAITQVDLEWFKQAFQRPGAASSTLAYYRALIRFATVKPDAKVFEAMRHKIRIPVMLLWGEKDHAIGTELNNGVEEVVPDIEYHVVKGCSHWVQQDFPEETNRLLKAWLERTKGKARL